MAEDLHLLYSLSKSFTSTAVGIAIDEGRLSLDDTVISFFPDELPKVPSDNLRAMRVRHLLSMSTGHDEDPTKFNRSGAVTRTWAAEFLDFPVLHEPGTHFVYNSLATYMLSAIVQRVTGEKLIDYLRPRLFAPLGIKDATWEESPQGINTGGWGLSIEIESIAKFGQMLLQKGMWEGNQVVSEAWVDMATRPHISNGDDPKNDWCQGYGFQFWRCRHNAYRGDGAFGQYCVVMPDQQMVVAFTSWVDDMQRILNIVWKYLLPAVQPNELPEDPEAYQALSQKLESLSRPGPEGFPVRAKSVQSFIATAPDSRYQSISIDRRAQGVVLTFHDKNGEHRVNVGYNEWSVGSCAWEGEGEKRVAARGGWNSEGRFLVTIIHLATPASTQLEFEFLHQTVKVNYVQRGRFDAGEGVLFEGATR